MKTRMRCQSGMTKALFLLCAVFFVMACDDGRSSNNHDDDDDDDVSDGDGMVPVDDDDDDDSSDEDGDGLDGDDDDDSSDGDGMLPDDDDDDDSSDGDEDEESVATEDGDGEATTDGDEDGDGSDGDEELDTDTDQCEGCLIDDLCIPAGQDHPVFLCAQCNPEQNNQDWSPKLQGTECRPAAGICDVAEVCDGVNEDCPADGFVVDGEICNDDNNCTDNDMCSGGTCSGQTYICNDHGTCNSDDNLCTCTTGYTGDYCDACTDNYSGYPDCQRVTTPGFLFIEAGSFWMGSPAGTCPEGYPGSCTSELGRNSNETLHYVTLTYDFEMSRYEITEAQFEGLMGWNAMDTYDSDCSNGCGDDHPMKYISWYDTLAYANQLSLDAGLTACYVLSNVGCENGGNVGTDYMDCFDSDATYGGIDSATVMLAGDITKPQDCEGYRLPTEAEWEYAIRAGTTTAFYNGGITYTGYDPVDPNLDQIGWYYGNSFSYGTKPVGGKEPNAWGLYDMSGNLWEWTWDWYQTVYQNDVTTDPVGPSTGSYRVIRGGNWSDVAGDCRSATRSGFSPGNRDHIFGARLCSSRP